MTGPTSEPAPPARRRRRIRLASGSVLALTALVAWWIIRTPAPSAPPDRVIRWTAEPGEALFTADGRSLVAGERGVTRVRLDQPGADLRGQILEGSNDLREEWPPPQGIVNSAVRPVGVAPVAVSPDGRWIAASNQSTHTFFTAGPLVMRVWDAQSGSLAATLPIDYRPGLALARPFVATFAARGSVLQVARDTDRPEIEVIRWDTRTWRPLPRVVIPRQGAFPPTWVDDGSALFLSDVSAPHWVVHDIATNRARGSVSLPTNLQGVFIPAVATPDGRTAVLRLPDGRCQIWDVATDRLRAETPPIPTWVEARTSPMLAMTSDGKSAAVTSDDHEVWILDITEGRIRARIPSPPSDQQVLLEFSPDGRTLAIADAPKIVPTAWDRFQQGLGRSLGAVDMAGWVAASGGISRFSRVRLVDARTGRTLRELAMPPGDTIRLSFAPDGKILACHGPIYRNGPPQVETLLWDLP